ncbi:hypothetical protein [Megasphaera sp.]|jgi:hypothetical protein
MAKYSHTSIDFFLSLPVADLRDWVTTVSGEIDRQNKEIEKAGKGGGRHG